MSRRGRRTKRQLLPTKYDFVPTAENLDELCAWEHFGGLTLEEAKTLFEENPLYYQEDFMFMGANAFLFYFPVLDQFLRSAPDVEDDDDHEAWIISQCIRQQFLPETLEQLQSLLPAVRSLADFVRSNLRRFGHDKKSRRRVRKAWGGLVDHIEALTSE